MAQLGLGTVQFGLDYGISNSGGKTAQSEVMKILKLASESSISVLDTALNYGQSEEVLGATLPENHSFRIITKTSGFKKNQLRTEDIEQVKSDFKASLKKLKQKQVEGILVHQADDLLVDGGKDFFECLVNIKKSGKVNKVGVSVYTENQLHQILDQYRIDLVQLPINVLDQHFVNSGILKDLKSEGIEIHLRSVFLQGLLLLSPAHIADYFSPILPVLEQYHDFLTEHRLSPAQGALCFANQIEEIDHILLGVNNVLQLQDNIRSYQKVKNCRLPFSSFSVNNKRMINPVFWDFK
jgi:aryl-alcohol dehydrogenase-like predicted oxidoreductase